MRISIKTTKGVHLAADYYEAENPKGWIVYTHMMPATKESWEPLASYLATEGFSGIAFDLRGHGDSEKGPDGYKDFSDEEHRASAQDIEDAVDFLKSHGAEPERIASIGASIGANLSLVRLSEHPEQKIAVFLSAGLNYRGIETAGPVKNLKEGQRVFFIASRDDENNANQNQMLYDAVPEEVRKEIQIYESGGHGTHILEAHPELKEKIRDFLGE